MEYLNCYILLIILIILIYLIKNTKIIELNQVGGNVGSTIKNIFTNTYDLGVKNLSNSISTIDNIVTNISCNNKNKEECSNNDKCLWVENNGCIGKLK